MAWANNNKKNARFNPNRKDDRLLLSTVTSRREHKPRKETGPEEELVSTDPGHVLSMQPETRVDWLQMALMQAGTGKLKAAALFGVITDPAFGPGGGGAAHLKPLKALVLANLHLFSPRQKRAIEEAVGGWAAAVVDGRGGAERERAGVPATKRAQGPREGSGRSGGGSSSSSSSSSGHAHSRRRRRAQKQKQQQQQKRASGKSKGRSKSRSRSRSRQRAQPQQQQSQSSCSRSRSRGRRRDASKKRS